MGFPGRLETRSTGAFKLESVCKNAYLKHLALFGVVLA